MPSMDGWRDRWMDGWIESFISSMTSFNICNGWVDGAWYHGEKYGFHLGYGYLDAPFIGLLGSNIGIDPTIFWYVVKDYLANLL